LLADARFVLEPDFERLAVRLAGKPGLNDRAHVLWNGPPLLPASSARLLVQKEEQGMDAVLGVDLGKNVCSVVGLDAAGAVVMRRKMRRETLIGLAEKLPPCILAMEACCGAHHLGRAFADHGHKVRLMSPEHARPYVKAQKNDDRDAEGIAEAARRPTMRFVELKTQDQLDIPDAPPIAATAWSASGPL